MLNIDNKGFMNALIKLLDYYGVEKIEGGKIEKVNRVFKCDGLHVFAIRNENNENFAFASTIESSSEYDLDIRNCHSKGGFGSGIIANSEMVVELLEDNVFVDCKNLVRYKSLNNC